MKNLSNLLGIIFISVSIVSCGGEENNQSAKPSTQESKELKEYPFNVQWVSDISPSDLEIIISYEEECEEIRGKANEVENYGQWKSEIYGRCN